MLKLVLIIDCGSCDESFERVAVSCDRNPRSWHYLAGELETNAEADGWLFHDRDNLCPDCAEDMPFSVIE